MVTVKLKLTVAERAKCLFCSPWVSRVVDKLPIPKTWKMRFFRWQITTLADSAMRALKDYMELAKKESQKDAIAACQRLSDTASVEVNDKWNIKTSCKWESDNDHNNGKEIRICARVGGAGEGDENSRQD